MKKKFIWKTVANYGQICKLYCIYKICLSSGKWYNKYKTTEMILFTHKENCTGLFTTYSYANGKALDKMNIL